MVSIAAKISMFATMSLAFDFTAQLTKEIQAMEASLKALNDKHITQQGRIKDISDDMDDIKDQQITGDYFISNDEKLWIPINTAYQVHEFTVKAGEVLEFMANVTTD